MEFIMQRNSAFSAKPPETGRKISRPAAHQTPKPVVNEVLKLDEGLDKKTSELQTEETPFDTTYSVLKREEDATLSEAFIKAFGEAAPIPVRPPNMPEDYDLNFRSYLKTLPEGADLHFTDALGGRLHANWLSGTYFKSGAVDDIGLWQASERQAMVHVMKYYNL